MQTKHLAPLAALTGLALTSTAMAQTGAVAAQRTAKAGYAPETVVVGARLGASDVETLDSMSFTYGAFGDYALGTNLLVGGGVDYWNQSSGTVASQSVSINDLALSAGAKVVFTNLTVPFRPYAGAALTLHRFQISIAEESQGANPRIDRFRRVASDVSAEPGFDLAGGVMYRVQRDVDVGGELRYRKLFDSTVNLDQLQFTGGLSYNL